MKNIKKVGLITYHEATSYGGMLQAYALQTIIKKNRYNCEIIDYHRTEKSSQNYIIEKSLKQKLKKYIINFSITLDRKLMCSNHEEVKRKIDEFSSKYLNIGSTSYNSIDELISNPPLYDAYVTGSDQVWNPQKKHLKAYCLTFVPKNKKTIAYAPSIGLSELPNECKASMKSYIKDIQYISCRENIGAKELSKLIGRDVISVLDPTLLINPEEWNTLAVNPNISEPYVLSYFIGNLNHGRSIAKQISKKMGYKQIVIPVSPQDIFASSKVKGCGPSEFLGLIKNASFICTDSFHGTAFAINYNRPFISFAKRDYASKSATTSRLQSILEILNLEDRLMTPNDKLLNSILKLDFSKPNILLKEQRRVSTKFLIESLSYDKRL